MKNLIAGMITLMALLGTAGLSGCNTLEGAGKDVEAGGEKIQSLNCTSEENKTKAECQK